eukprot:CAMPEP_0114603608 /NCGR_PEP_ID=MMETSP0168-20121206/114_1 /TAXON_ID=95228 ORGANISM="Vannella sp., Strain DIVA3 517/6/12" /NCGR_SAMPLE_ID=MMETSP0168 /ASSEMBLY_ACC=CAM_ASM_000044 /LENGTH=78 /DNA_ID=CAMNT_0001814407 /DNA_START=121 /DNA_END=355 /DNA_ORIENTATION=+
MASSVLAREGLANSFTKPDRLQQNSLQMFASLASKAVAAENVEGWMDEARFHWDSTRDAKEANVYNTKRSTLLDDAHP